jgi:hypothetical protein
MGEKGYNQEQNRPTVKMSFEDVSARLSAQSGNTMPPRQAPAPRQPAPRPTYESQQQRPQRPQRPAYNSPYPSPNGSVEVPSVAQPNRLKLPELSKRGKRRLLMGTTAVAVVGGLVAGYNANIGNIQNAFSSFGAGGQSADGFVMTPNQKLGQKSLAPDQCMKPEAALLVVTVSGNLPLVPELADAAHSTPVDIAPYMTEANKKKLPADQQDEFEKFITKDGYTHVEVKDLPLALHVCEPTNSVAIEESGNLLSIHRPQLQVSFEDPWSEFGSNMPPITASFQMNGASDGDTDASKGDYLTMPNPANSLFLGTSKDAAYNKSVATLLAGMKTEAQQQQMVKVLLATVEEAAVRQLDNVVSGSNNISNMTSLQDAVDNGLTQRLVGKSVDDLLKEKALSRDGNYSVKMDVPTDPATKRPITSNDPKTGASPIVNIDLNHDFNITGGKLINGAMKKPTFTIPSPSPTPTPTPTK